MTSDVPILGQPLELRAWFLQMLIVCKCSNTPLLMIGQPGAMSVACPECRKTYSVQAPTEMQFQFGVGLPTAQGGFGS